MLEFKKFKLSDIEKIKKYTTLHNTYSCETNFINLFIWQDIYKNRYAEKDGMLFVKSGEGEDECFCLPFGKDIKKYPFPLKLIFIKKICFNFYFFFVGIFYIHIIQNITKP